MRKTHAEELSYILIEAGGCSSKCTVKLGPWTMMPTSFIIITEHNGYKIPYVITRESSQTTPTLAMFYQVLAIWANQAPMWHQSPGSEDDWRKELTRKKESEDFHEAPKSETSTLSSGDSRETPTR